MPVSLQMWQTKFCAFCITSTTHAFHGYLTASICKPQLDNMSVGTGVPTLKEAVPPPHHPPSDVTSVGSIPQGLCNREEGASSGGGGGGEEKGGLTITSMGRAAPHPDPSRVSHTTRSL